MQKDNAVGGRKLKLQRKKAVIGREFK